MTAPTPPTPRAAPRSTLGSLIIVVALVAGSLVAISLVRSGYQRYALDPHRDDKTRVLFVGDSMMFGASGALARRFEPEAETRFVGAYGTGLLSGQGWWNREITEQIETWRPDVVVIEACCNYGIGEPEYQLDDGTRIDSESEAMYAQWAEQADDAVSRARDRGAQVFWVVTPAADEALWPTYKERIPRFNDIVDQTGVARIDWAKVLTPEGTFTATLDVDGTTKTIRQEDGLHITDDGNALIVAATWDVVAPALGLA